jgi:hypothetical protein
MFSDCILITTGSKRFELEGWERVFFRPFPKHNDFSQTDSVQAALQQFSYMSNFFPLSYITETVGFQQDRNRRNDKNDIVLHYGLKYVISKSNLVRYFRSLAKAPHSQRLLGSYPHTSQSLLYTETSL